MSNPTSEELAIAAAGKARVAESDAAGQAGVAQTWDVSYVARSALREIERVTEVERDLAAKAPRARLRLRLVADTAAVCLAQVVAHTARQMMSNSESEGR